ncbi:MAG: S26 family signal peptidase [Pirellulales bacterium]
MITFVTPEGDKRMKRVIGLPGEDVQMLRFGEVVIDGKQVPHPPGSGSSTCATAT